MLIFIPFFEELLCYNVFHQDFSHWHLWCANLPGQPGPSWPVIQAFLFPVPLSLLSFSPRPTPVLLHLLLSTLQFCSQSLNNLHLCSPHLVPGCQLPPPSAFGNSFIYSVICSINTYSVPTVYPTPLQSWLLWLHSVFIQWYGNGVFVCSRNERNSCRKGKNVRRFCLYVLIPGDKLADSLINNFHIWRILENESTPFHLLQAPVF